eukprot:CAMPEP_0119406328 /NCGR_PEP_ID=MMETSP1335-20130426/700_1 /TAXON_ID=259385 /ORGANISM="Chrysoculter rhomboideus, Strain RCC1486" /LENGTH=78 /DNA_ID=CAMNT_0007430401 /DNA_START=197 /DNA_END=429 /DNA_ORIENTATION=+
MSEICLCAVSGLGGANPAEALNERVTRASGKATYFTTAAHMSAPFSLFCNRERDRSVAGTLPGTPQTMLMGEDHPKWP